MKTKKPTGDAEVPWYVERAWEVEEQIILKSNTLTIDDAELAEASDDGSVIELSSDDDTATARPPAKKTATVKVAHRVDAAQLSGAKRARGNPATATLASIGAVYNPDAMREREATRFQSNLQVTQAATAAAELRELRTLVRELSEQTHAAQRRADKAEHSLEMHKALSKLSGQRSGRRGRPRSRSSSDHSRSSSPSPLRRRSRPSGYHRRMPSPRYVSPSLREPGLTSQVATLSSSSVPIPSTLHALAAAASSVVAESSSSSSNAVVLDSFSMSVSTPHRHK